MRTEVLFSQRNWILKNESPSDKMPTEITEYDVYSDARFTGQVDLPDCPYAFLNALSSESGTVDTRMVLRIESYDDSHVSPSIDWSKTDDATYHGGWYDDEIISLASLILGVRLASGGISRRWSRPADDRYGQPNRLAMKPKLPFVIKGGGILPDVTGEHSMMNLEHFGSILQIEPSRFVSLVRACSLYRNALWMVELDTNLAWLLFVSALETGARDVCGSGSVTESFSKFVIQFRPSPPKQRPDAGTLQFEWTKENFKRMLKLVYDYRSRALHDGKPFPPPMLSRPWQHGHGAPPNEVPGPGLAVSTMGGTWRKEELPINLHTFHYITRHVLLEWWARELSISQEREVPYSATKGRRNTRPYR